MQRTQLGFTSTELLFSIGGIVFLVGAGGWVWNIVKLAEMCCNISGWLILRAIGVFVPPLGAILGFL